MPKIPAAFIVLFLVLTTSMPLVSSFTVVSLFRRTPSQYHRRIASVSTAGIHKKIANKCISRLFGSQDDNITGSNSDTGYKDSDNNAWNADNYWLHQIQKQGEERPDYEWFRDRSSLPFECTACGKCCKTKGNVYLNPEEHEAAARLLKISKEDFVQEYASHTLVEPGDNGKEDVWIRLLDHSSTTESTSSSSSEEEGDAPDQRHGCIFLQEDNTCQIYEARPIQCSTYPFWPTILASRQKWNAEVRRLDEVDDSSTDNNLPPAWTREGGGCEGMQRIGTKYSDERDDPIQGVLKGDVYEQAFMYEQDERRFPRDKEP